MLNWAVYNHSTSKDVAMLKCLVGNDTFLNSYFYHRETKSHENDSKKKKKIVFFFLLASDARTQPQIIQIVGCKHFRHHCIYIYIYIYMYVFNSIVEKRDLNHWSIYETLLGR